MHVRHGGFVPLLFPIIPLFPAYSDLGRNTPSSCGSYVFQFIAIFVLVLLVVSVCTCLLTRVAQCELLVNSLSNLASRVLTAWQWEEAWLLLLPGTTCSVEDKGRTGSSKKKKWKWVQMVQPSFPVCLAEALTPAPEEL